MRDFGDSALFPVYDVLKASILVDGFDLILDVEGSRGSYLRDLRDGTEYLDMFGFFGSSALGMNHPAITGDEEFQQELAVVASNKPSNSDIYTEPMARFVAAFARVLGDSALPHLFFVDGGAWRWKMHSRLPSTGRVGGTKAVGCQQIWGQRSCT